MTEKTKERIETAIWYAICVIGVLLYIAAIAADIALYIGQFKFFVLD